MPRLTDFAAALDAFDAEFEGASETEMAELLAPPPAPKGGRVTIIPACPSYCDCPDCQAEEAYWADAADAHFEQLAISRSRERATAA